MELTGPGRGTDIDCDQSKGGAVHKLPFYELLRSRAVILV